MPNDGASCVPFVLHTIFNVYRKLIIEFKSDESKTLFLIGTWSRSGHFATVL